MTKLATIGADVPPDLMAATGRYAGPLGWNIDRRFPRAEQWLENKYPLWAFSILEDWAAGALDYLGAVVFSRSDDSAHRLYYYVSELRRRGLLAGLEPIVFDVARIERPTSETHSIASVRRLAERLGVSDKALEQGIRETNTRRVTPSRVAGSGPICLLGGSAPPDHRLHRVIEKSGWMAVGETLGENWRRLGARVMESTGDPAAAIGHQIHAEQVGSRAFFDRSHALVAEVQTNAAKAVVLWYIEEDEAQIWHLPAQRKALEAAGIPTLVLTRCDWHFTDDAAPKITSFLTERAI